MEKETRYGVMSKKTQRRSQDKFLKNLFWRVYNKCRLVAAGREGRICQKFELLTTRCLRLLIQTVVDLEE